MRKKTTSRKSSLNPPKRGVVSNKQLAQQKDLGFQIFTAFNDAIWLVALLATLFLGAALFSFDMSDPAFSRSADSDNIQNIGGVVGAYIADIAYYLFGLSIWWVIIEACILLFRAFKPLLVAKKIDDHHHLGLSILGTSIMIAGSSLLEHWLLPITWNSSLPIGTGGLWGQTITPMLDYGIGRSSGIAISVLLMLLGLSLMLQMTWQEMGDKIKTNSQWLWFHLVKRPSKLIRELPQPKTMRQTVEAVEDITAIPVEAPTGANSNRKKNTSTTNKTASESTSTNEAHAQNSPKTAIPVQTSLFENNNTKGKQQAAHLRTDLPSLDLLQAASTPTAALNPEQLQATAQLIETKLAEFGVSVQVVSATTGPVITRYEIEPASGIKGSQIVNLAKDLARALALQSVRVVETIAGKKTMGIELPNSFRQDVSFRELLNAAVFDQAPSKLTLAMGKDIAGVPVVADLAKMPHVLVAGTTGSGKSVAINTMILSMLYKATPAEVRFIMVDPKMLELSVYEDIPHLLAPVVTDMKHASNALNWCVAEMERRYRLLAHIGVRQLSSYNEKIQAAIANQKPLFNPFSLTPDEPEPLEALPHIVVIIDELADLMMVEGKKVEQQIARLAQKARAAGIHLILATQRPSVDVITGLIKANIPTRIAFQVSSKIDSRTILDQGGAENLLGKGDMLFLPPGTAEPTRLHAGFVRDEDVHQVVNFLKSQAPAQYVEGLLSGEAGLALEAGSGSAGGAEKHDELFDQAVEFILNTRKTSISSLQRHLRIGYNRAANLMEELERAGIVSAPELGGSRQILAKRTLE
ncbi:DNA translocase FtsK [Vitreoscilla sp. C1]|uniref:DNA translocase FtsK n=1 Tax=Vitreoscilla sp. (strain C1) TaxID=96942 RepID=UPI000CDCA3B3|nr:DNA translocase FtsK [Vitreoscilla sp. C1]